MSKRAQDNAGIYGHLTRFLLPLAITLVVVEFGGQALSAGMARVPRATETLAAYGLAWSLMLFLSSPLTHAKALGLVMADSLAARQKVMRFIIGVGLVLMALVTSLAVTPLGVWVMADIYRIDAALMDTVRLALLWLTPVPLVKGLALYYAGLLIRVRRTDIVSYANIASIGVGIVLVFLLLPLPLIQQRPIWLPIIVIHVNSLAELAIGYWGVRRFANTSARPATDSLHTAIPNTSPTLTYAAIIRFFWPLALVITMQEMSRPLINVYISRSDNGVQALAVLTVVYALGQFPYRWLNDIRSLPTAFQEVPNHRHHIRRFAVICGAIALGLMLLLFWTPLRDYILQTLMGVDAELAALARVPLMIYAGFPIVVILRAYCQGIAMVEKRTQALAFSAPLRTGAIWATLVMGPWFGIMGATLGVAALFAGFAMEAVAIWGAVIGWRMVMERQVMLRPQPK